MRVLSKLMQRRELFNFLNVEKKESVVIMAPYLGGDLNNCLDCEAPCVNECEEKILEYNNAPLINFSLGGCTYCEACFNACEKDVLNELDVQIKAMANLSTKSCIAWNSVVCNSCADVCDVRAIKFFGMFKPTVNFESCTGCGMCLHVCPSNAIQMRVS